MQVVKNVKFALTALGSTKKAKASAWFFKTGPGQYGEGDVFVGVTVPEQRLVAKKFSDLPLGEVEKLLHSKEHEFRLTALLVLIQQFKRGDEKVRSRIYKIYLQNTKWINNWDLVDLSAPNIVGTYLRDHPRGILLKLAKSKSLWEKRIAILSTFAFIVEGEASDTLKIAKLLLKDENDLIHKAVGWMLREVGKRCGEIEELAFLDRYYKVMPRTMLRYAIERFTPEQKAKFMKRK